MGRETPAGVRLLGRLRAAISSAHGWRRALWAAGAGVLSVLAMPPFFLWPILFLTIPALVWLIDGAGGSTARSFRSPSWAAALAGWWFGFGYFLAGLFWIGEAFLVEAEKFAWALPFAVTLLPAGLALFWAAAAAAARLAWPAGLSRLLVLAMALAGAEWLRGHVLTGLPWNVLGTALTYPLPLMQGVSLLGIYGLTLWTVLAAAAPLVLAADASAGEVRRAACVGLSIALAPLALLFAYGAGRLANASPSALHGPRVRIVQPAVPQRDKWRPEKRREIFERHLELSRRDQSGALDDLRGVTHVVWPEAAMPFMPLNSPETLAAIGDLLPDGVRLVTGALRVEETERGRLAYNSLMAFGANGGLEVLYDKIHLVPFGEYLPLQKTLEALGFEQLARMRGGFTAGRAPRPVLDIQGLPSIAGLICYEAIFPAAVVQGERPSLFINLTNDGWFGRTSGPYQHFHQARLRAVEEGLPLIRAANNGVSAVIDSHGRVLGKLDLDERGVIDASVPAAIAAPLYAAYGDGVFLLNALAFVFLALALVRAKRISNKEAR